jgi:hypothetical protein
VLPWDSTLSFSGHIRVNNSLFGTTGVLIRLGNSDNGPIVAKGIVSAGMGEKVMELKTHLSSSSDPNIQQYPTAPVAKIPAMHTGTAGTLYVIAYRASGSGNWEVKQPDAQLEIIRYPTVV